METKDDFGDDESRSDSGLPRFKGKEGRQDVIVVVTPYYATPRHWTGKFYLRCLGPGKGEECCKRFGKPTDNDSCMIIHVAERMGNGPWKKVGEAKEMGFCERKRNGKLTDIARSLQTVKRDCCDNDVKAFRKMLLLLTCTDTTFQNMNVMPYQAKEVKLLPEMVEAAKAAYPEFKAGLEVDRADVLDSIKRIDHGEGDGQNADTEGLVDNSGDFGMGEGGGGPDAGFDIDAELDNIGGEQETGGGGDKDDLAF